MTTAEKHSVEAPGEVEQRRQFWHDLAAIRQRQGLTQSEVAERMGTTQGFVSRLEAGENDPLRSTEDRYAAALGYVIDRRVRPFSESSTDPDTGDNLQQHPHREIRVLDLHDIRTMPGFNPKVPNGADSVSRGIIYFGTPRHGPDGLVTVCCVNHGATLCVAKLREGGMIWRCPACNEGAFVPAEAPLPA